MVPLDELSEGFSLGTAAWNSFRHNFISPIKFALCLTPRPTPELYNLDVLIHILQISMNFQMNPNSYDFAAYIFIKNYEKMSNTTPKYFST